jgi:hypothetical protein
LETVLVAAICSAFSAVTSRLLSSSPLWNNGIIWYNHSVLVAVRTGWPLTQSDYTRRCINTVFLLRTSTELLETCRGLEHIIEEIVRQVGYLPELYEDARSEKYKILTEVQSTQSFDQRLFSSHIIHTQLFSQQFYINTYFYRNRGGFNSILHLGQ